MASNCRATQNTDTFKRVVTSADVVFTTQLEFAWTC